MPGLAVLMAPAWWFTSSAVVVYQVGVWITVALALLALWPLSTIACRTGVSRQAGVIVAAVVVLAPSRSLLSNYLLAESGLLLTTAALLVAADRLWSRHKTLDAVWFGAAVGGTVLFHGRGVATAVAAGLWTLLLLRRDPKRALIAGASALFLSVGVYLLYRGITSEVLTNDARLDMATGDLGYRDLHASAASAVGQVWYATLAWPGVAVVGGMAVVRWRKMGGMAALITLGIPVALIVSTVQLNPNAGLTRMDPWFYGRYMDQWWTILAVIGLSLLVRIKWPAMSAAALAASLVAGIGMLFFTVPSIPLGMRWVDVHVLGITPWLRLDDYADGRGQSWGVIVMTGVALTILVLVLASMRVWVLPTLATLWIWLSIAQDIQGVDLRLGARDSASDTYGLSLLPGDSVIGIDERLGVQANTVVFAADPREVAKVNVDTPPDGVDIVYVHWFIAHDAPPGVKLLEATVGGQFVAWVEPGELQRHLDDQGLLVEPGSSG